MKYQVNIQTSHHFTVRDPKPFRVTMQFESEEARRIHESLKSAKADTFATLVSRSMPHGRRAPLHNGTCVRERTARVAVGDHDRLAVLVEHRSQSSSLSPRFRSTSVR